MKFFEIVDLKYTIKPFVMNIFLIMVLGSIGVISLVYLNHYLLSPIFNYEIEKWMGIGFFMALLGIYIGMCLQKSRDSNNGERVRMNF